MYNLTDYKNAKQTLEKYKFPKGLLAFGSARLPMDNPHIKEVEEISEICAKRILKNGNKISFITGGGPSVMTAWLKPAFELGAKTSGMAMLLPHETKEQQLQYCDRSTSFIFDTFQSRKALMLDYAKCIIVFKGGTGTLDELFEALVAMKTGKIEEFPIFIYPADFYSDVLNFKKLVDGGTLSPGDFDTLHFINSKDELLNELFKIIDGDN